MWWCCCGGGGVNLDLRTLDSLDSLLSLIFLLSSPDDLDSSSLPLFIFSLSLSPPAMSIFNFN